MIDKKAKETMVVACNNCDARVAATVEGFYQEYYDEPGFAVRYAFLRCPECKTPILTSQDDEDARFDGEDEEGDRWSKPTRMYPETKLARLGLSVPEPIRKAFAEAKSCFGNGKAYTACAIMCRKVLEGICDSHEAKGSNLAARLKDLSDRGELDKRLYDWITTLRIVGNEAAHDVGVTVSREDASDLLDLTEAVAEYLYTFKEKFETFQERRKGREAGKRTEGKAGDDLI
jgi:hypothetical protein